jgi:hypothetical protein
MMLAASMEQFLAVTDLVTFAFNNKQRLPVEIRKPLLFLNLNGCGGQI